MTASACRSGSGGHFSRSAATSDTPFNGTGAANTHLLDARNLAHRVAQLPIEREPARPRLIQRATVEALPLQLDRSSSARDRASNPSGTERRLMNARPISPAPISSTTDSAS